MKRLISAVAVSFALVAQANAQSFPDGYTPLSAEDLKPVPGARSEWQIRKEELLAGFPQPSFRDYNDTVTAGGNTALATIESNRAN